MKKLSIFLYINAALCALYTLLSLSFHLDISLVAFPICVAFSAAVIYFTLIDLIKKKTLAHQTLINLLVSYEPFVFITAWVFQRAGKNAMPFALDVVAAITWALVLISACVIKYVFLSEKRIYELCPEFKKEHDEKPNKKAVGMKRVWKEICETVDAIVWAVFVIGLVNIFVVQLYRIPSESMVPTFLVNDRAIVWKTTAGPKFPLSEVGIPLMQKYEKGDIVVFRNPHYKDDRKSEVKNTLSNFLYMITFTLIKSNVDENGELKADPLVKRIAGVGGEQLMMMDGTLYARTAESPSFRPVATDGKFAAWDLNNLSAQSKSKVLWIPLTESEYQDTLEIEAERRSLDLVSAAIECQTLAKTFASYSIGDLVDEKEIPSMFSQEERTIYSLFSSIDDRTIQFYTQDGGSQWFTHFMTDWIDTVPSLSSLSEETDQVTGNHLVGGDLYSDSLFRLNVMTKLLFGRLIVRNVELMSDPNVGAKDRAFDSKRVELLEKAQTLYIYVMRMDQRNMPVFPANDANGNPQYIPDGAYFMMGDNRYNSLDMRHSYVKKLVPFYGDDSYSICYNTDIDPQYVKQEKILGKAQFTIWPLNRSGSIKGKVRN